jgi:hypothetical protein
VKGRETALARWKDVLQYVPELKMEIKDAIQEGSVAGSPLWSINPLWTCEGLRLYERVGG